VEGAEKELLLMKQKIAQIKSQEQDSFQEAIRHLNVDRLGARQVQTQLQVYKLVTCLFD
jgi:hypothetical protein